ncbi:MAG: DUF2497 domain-containing protein [Novosphingobium sp.]|jgi:cell pole-organizing protein PopZ|nr:DUF2497 domain-containing protein [Novosphingobium sp.]
MRNAGEPTVEEILESIKQVIARDDGDGVGGDGAGASRPDMAADPDDADRDTGGNTDDVLDLGEDALIAAADPVGAESARQEPPAAPDPIVNPGARESMRESLAALTRLAEPGAPGQAARTGETTLEGLVRELLRPALADWLDRHLPAIVERMVAAEIARIVDKNA